MKALTALIFIAASVGIFFWYVKPAWATVSQTRSEITQYQDDVTEAQQAATKLTQLTTSYTSFNKEQVAQLQEFLPTGVDPIHFVLSINSIAAQYGSGLASVNVGTAGPVTGQNFNSLPVTFSVAMTYPNFLLFLRDLERSLPLTDVASLSFTSPDAGSVYTFTATVQTYYLQ